MSPSAPSPLVPTVPPAPSPGATMRAVVQPGYGGPEILSVAEVPVPALTPDGVLVRVRVASTNKGDWHLLTGTPYLVRAAYGFARPSRPVLGMALAGQVVAVGSSAAGFAVGDRVFAEVNRGGFAEYACVPAKELAHMPEGLSYEDAATIPVAGTTALQGLRDGGHLAPGQSVLINGAAGGVGSFAVQIAKAMGAEVTAVCSTRNIDLVRAAGADHVIDHTVADFTAGDRRWDVIFDLVGNHSHAACRRVLTPTGRLLAAAGGAENTWIGPMLDVLGGVVSNLWSKQTFVPVANRRDAASLATVAELVVAGKVRPVLDQRHPLDEVGAAMRYLGLGRSRGKSLVTL